MSRTEPTFNNFFSLFELPVEFDIDTAQLDTLLRQLQQQYHPDKLNTDNSGTDTQKYNQKTSSQSLKNSAVINHAYEVLSHPDSRAYYLLELAEQNINMNATIADLDFLEDAMQMRVALDDAITTSDLESINALKQTISAPLNRSADSFKLAYNEENWTAAIDAAQKLRFLVKLRKDLDSAIDEMHTQNDDDDLYL